MAFLVTAHDPAEKATAHRPFVGVQVERELLIHDYRAKEQAQQTTQRFY